MICYLYLQLIPISVQQRAFQHLPTEIEVLLPDENITQWRITWYSKNDASTTSSTDSEDSEKPESIGELAAGWCDYFRQKFIRDENRYQVFEMALYEVPWGGLYILLVDPAV